MEPAQVAHLSSGIQLEQKWKTFPRQFPHIPRIVLHESEVQAIDDYAEKYYPKNKVWHATTWQAYTTSKTNHNATGMKGEWGNAKFFLDPPVEAVQDFLVDRTLGTGDLGDFIIVGDKSSKVFDVKTRSQHTSPDVLMTSELGEQLGYGAEVNAYVKPKEWLQGFIFTLYNHQDHAVYLMGWMLADEFFKNADVIMKGTRIKGFNFNYSNDVYTIPYRRLHPMMELLDCQYFPITQQMTDYLKTIWKQQGFTRKSWDAYAQLLKDMSILPSAS